MNKKSQILLISLFILMLGVLHTQEKKNDFPVLKGPYLGQKPPGMTPEIFAQVSTEKNEINSVFSPDGSEFYFSIFSPGKGYTIMVMREEEDGWTKPQVAPFSGKYSEVDMFITHDGKQFFYISKRPLRENSPRSSGYQIWVMEKEIESWSEPRNLGPSINSGARQLYPTLTRKGAIYFGSNRKGFGGADLFRSLYINGSYTEPENLGDAINTEYDETDVFVAPDESYIIFTSSNRPDGFGSGDHYISFQKTNGSWTKAVNMGEKFNTTSSEFCPMLSPDGKYFFFTSGRRGSDDIYWVDAGVIDEFKSGLLK
jgi:Tol biopolymer transport system component